MKAWRAGTFHLGGVVPTWFGKNFKTQTHTETHAHVCIYMTCVYIYDLYIWLILNHIYKSLVLCVKFYPVSNAHMSAILWLGVQCQHKMADGSLCPPAFVTYRRCNDCGWEAAKFSNDSHPQKKPGNSNLSEFNHRRKVFVFRWTVTRFNSASRRFKTQFKKKIKDQMSLLNEHFTPLLMKMS